MMLSIVPMLNILHVFAGVFIVSSLIFLCGKKKKQPIIKGTTESATKSVDVKSVDGKSVDGKSADGKSVDVKVKPPDAVVPKESGGSSKQEEAKKRTEKEKDDEKPEDAPEGPRKIPLNEKERKIAAGAKVGVRDYPTLDNVKSDWE